MKIVLNIFLYCLPLTYVSGQSYHRTISALKRNSGGLEYIQNDICEIRIVSKIKDKRDTFSKSILVDFRQYRDSGTFIYFKEGSPYKFLYRNDSIFYVHRDSFQWHFQVKKKFRLKRGHVPGSLFYLRFLPLLDLGFYSGWKNISLTHDSLTMKKMLYQGKRRDSIFRTIVFDRSYRIDSVIMEYPSYADVDEFLIFKIRRFSDTSIDDVSRFLGYYRFEFDSIQKLVTPITNTRDKIKIRGQGNNDSIAVRGKYILIDYWYLSCLPCHKLRPYLESIHQTVDTSKILIFGCNPYDSNEEIINASLRRNYRIPEIVADQWPMPPITEYPTVILYGPDMTIIKIWTGFELASVSEIQKMLDDL